MELSENLKKLNSLRFNFFSFSLQTALQNQVTKRSLKFLKYVVQVHLLWMRCCSYCELLVLHQAPNKACVILHSK